MVYITSDLFDGNSAHSHGDAAISSPWTNTDSPHTAGLGKRKRLEGEGGQSLYESRPMSAQDKRTDLTQSSCPHQQRSLPSSRSFARMHNYHTSSHDNNRNLSYSMYSASPVYTTSERRPVKQLKRISPKDTLVKSNSHLMDLDLDLAISVPNAATPSHAVTDLRSCHACKSAPKRRKDLENYLDCRRCEGRTCYICARQCFGGCDKAVCKKCIVEVGEEGDPWCLDCYAKDINS